MMMMTRRGGVVGLFLVLMMLCVKAAVPPSYPPLQPWPPSRSRIDDPRDQTARKLARALGDAEVAIKLVRWCVLVAFGGARFATWLTGELLAPLVTRTVAIVDVKGVIVDDGFSSQRRSERWCMDPRAEAGGGIVSTRRVEKALERAFRSRRVCAVVVRVSSPGGTASESALLYRRLQTLKLKKRDQATKRHMSRPRAAFLFQGDPRRRQQREQDSSSKSTSDKYRGPEVVAFVDDICTSGGYYVACAADVILATPCAVIGSIGVVTRSFGYQKQLKKLGVERRILASGNAKAGLDPFLPATRDALARERKVLRDLHEEFVETVKASRRGKLMPLKAADLAARADKEAWGSRAWVASFPPLRAATRNARALRGDGLFDGSVYAARTAKDLGLVDAICEDHLYDALKRRYGNRIRIKRFVVGSSCLDLTPPWRSSSSSSSSSSSFSSSREHKSAIEEDNWRGGENTDHDAYPRGVGGGPLLDLPHQMIF